MRIIGHSYRPRVPWYLVLGAILVGIIALTGLFFFCAGFCGFKPLPKLADLGSQGDFFGGHIGAIVGSITLLVVLLTAYMQLVYERRFRVREHFLSGITVIGQYDIDSPGCEQAMRLLDYYSAVALELKDDELLLLLNTVMTGDIRRKLESLDATKQEIYLDAREARRTIQQLLKSYHLARKNISQ